MKKEFEKTSNENSFWGAAELELNSYRSVLVLGVHLKLFFFF